MYRRYLFPAVRLGLGIEELEKGFLPIPVFLVAVAAEAGAEGEEVVSPAHQAELS